MLLGATDIDRVRWLIRDIASFFDPALMLMKLLGFLWLLLSKLLSLFSSDAVIGVVFFERESSYVKIYRPRTRLMKDGLVKVDISEIWSGSVIWWLVRFTFRLLMASFSSYYGLALYSDYLRYENLYWFEFYSASGDNGISFYCCNWSYGMFDFD